jgi:hypothetical protein
MKLISVNVGRPRAAAAGGGTSGFAGELARPLLAATASRFLSRLRLYTILLLRITADESIVSRYQSG